MPKRTNINIFRYDITINRQYLVWDYMEKAGIADMNNRRKKRGESVCMQGNCTKKNGGFYGCNFVSYIV